MCPEDSPEKKKENYLQEKIASTDLKCLIKNRFSLIELILS